MHGIYHGYVCLGNNDSNRDKGNDNSDNNDNNDGDDQHTCSGNTKLLLTNVEHTRIPQCVDLPVPVTILRGILPVDGLSRDLVVRPSGNNLGNHLGHRREVFLHCRSQTVTTTKPRSDRHASCGSASAFKLIPVYLAKTTSNVEAVGLFRWQAVTWRHCSRDQ